LVVAVVVVVFVGVVPTTLAPASFTAPIADDIARICDEGEEPPGGGVVALDEQVIDTEGSTAGVSAEAEAVETGALFGWCTRRSLWSGGMTVLDVDREGGEEGSGGMSAHTKLARYSLLAARVTRWVVSVHSVLCVCVPAKSNETVHVARRAERAAGWD
jgi:hypothetical protein